MSGEIRRQLNGNGKSMHNGGLFSFVSQILIAKENAFNVALMLIGMRTGARILRGSQEGGGAPKKVAVRFRIIPKRDSDSLLWIELRSEIADFYLIGVGKMVGLA